MPSSSGASFCRRGQYIWDSARVRPTNWRDRVVDPEASRFFKTLVAGGYNPDAHIDVLPRHRLIYVCVPKCASTTIKSVLSSLTARGAVAPDKTHHRRDTGLRAPSRVGLSLFHRLAASPSTLRFAFVRNPYARLVSAWADKFQNKPLVAGDSFVEKYLAHRADIDASLPFGREQTLSFGQFVVFAAASALWRLDAHWQEQQDLIAMPGIKLDHVGKVESFGRDFGPVLEHVGRGPELLPSTGLRLNASQHRPWPDYYSPVLADVVYRRYERDFELLRYPRALHASAA